jgi:hypothetical protein
LLLRNERNSLNLCWSLCRHQSQKSKRHGPKKSIAGWQPAIAVNCPRIRLKTYSLKLVEFRGEQNSPEFQGDAMRKIDHIEQQIRELSASEFAELREWILEQDWTAWDSKIERDAQGGKLHNLVAEAKEEYEKGKARKL